MAMQVCTESLHKKLHPTEDDPAGPLKKAIAHQDSLYKYISWDDPVETVGSYLGMVALIYRWLLKMGAIALGATSLASFASRSTRFDFVGRMRPEYKIVPEPTLNTTLKDIHDFIQYLAIQGQRILYGEDLSKTFGAFLGFTRLYWLVKILTPFDLEVLSLSSCAKAKAQDLTNSAVGGAKRAFNDAKAKSADLSSRSQEAAGSLASGTQQGAKNLAYSTQRTASNISSGAQQTAGNLAAGASQSAKNLASNTQQAFEPVIRNTQDTLGNLASGAQQDSRNVSSGAQQTAQSLSSGAQGMAGNLSSKVQQTAGKLLPEKSTARNSSTHYEQPKTNIQTCPADVILDGKSTVADRFSFSRRVQKD
ncbi:hypothetical protein RRF57_001745 [Xylaria bambusicola]|uniref:Reticulon domain-containing protein n=1 Tax=Xylaria bambusicola TaxID=326684 RepID=A0AAN7URF4_9PEZI